MERLHDYHYFLPPELIAQQPLAERDASRLMVLRMRSGSIEHRNFAEVAEILDPGDLLVLNDTRVTALRLYGERPTGGKVEALLLRPLGSGKFEALLKPAKRVAIGQSIIFGALRATVASIDPSGPRIIDFGDEEGLEDRLQAIGEVPLPPYIRSKLRDRERYQTVYSKTRGSAAAPTAGLHFTPRQFEKLVRRGVSLAWVTLDVGMDTFRPVQTENLSAHTMHGERYSIPAETQEAIRNTKGRIIAVGTTAVRALESFGSGLGDSGTTSIFIRPGYKFKVVDGMFTNFHLPKTTMMMMISALAGRENVLRAYESAIENRYRFLSFGDSMLII